jgi:hypothetical protein
MFNSVHCVNDVNENKAKQLWIRPEIAPMNTSVTSGNKPYDTEEILTENGEEVGS